MATYQQSFQGCRVEDDSGIYDFEWYPITQTFDGVERIVAYGRNLVTYVAYIKHYLFIGLSEVQAHGTTAQTVTSVGGTQHVVPFSPSVTDSSTGSKVFVTHKVLVSRYPISAHLWNVEVTVTDTDYYVNGSQIVFPS